MAFYKKISMHTEGSLLFLCDCNGLLDSPIAKQIAEKYLGLATGITTALSDFQSAHAETPLTPLLVNSIFSEDPFKQALLGRIATIPLTETLNAIAVFGYAENYETGRINKELIEVARNEIDFSTVRKPIHVAKNFGDEKIGYRDWHLYRRTLMRGASDDFCLCLPR